MNQKQKPNCVTDGENSEEKERISEEFIWIAAKDEKVSEAAGKLISCLSNDLASCKKSLKTKIDMRMKLLPCR
jgi:hypothetical protein